MSHEQTQAEPHDAGAAHRAPAKRTHVLVAEDNRLNSLLMQEQLRLLGFSAEFATTGRDALARWREAEFAALLTDIQMPGMDGYELASRIRDEEGDRPRMPIIALTANAFHDGSARWRAAGIDAYLMKPAELPMLKATLEHWIGARCETVATAAVPISDKAEAPVDLAVLTRTVGDDRTLFADFLAAFSASASEALHGIEVAVAASDRDRANTLAHQLKSSARAIGAIELGERCEALEAAAVGGDDVLLRASWQSFGAEANLVLRWLAANPVEAQPAGSDRPRP
jgi:CheY-like chemotaxis protein/HPt (histidine-containing phosphotransfer) domain-containing protein